MEYSHHLKNKVEESKPVIKRVTFAFLSMISFSSNVQALNASQISERLYTFASRMLCLFLAVTPYIFLACLVFGGFLILSSAGDAEQRQNGKKVMINGLIGLLIVYGFAYGITATSEGMSFDLCYETSS